MHDLSQTDTTVLPLALRLLAHPPTVRKAYPTPNADSCLMPPVRLSRSSTSMPKLLA